MFKTEENKDPLPFTNSKTTLTCTYKSGFVLSINCFEGVNHDNPDKVFAVEIDREKDAKL